MICTQIITLKKTLQLKKRLCFHINRALGRFSYFSNSLLNSLHCSLLLSAKVSFKINVLSYTQKRAYYARFSLCDKVRTRLLLHLQAFPTHFIWDQFQFLKIKRPQNWYNSEIKMCINIYIDKYIFFLLSHTSNQTKVSKWEW